MVGVPVVAGDGGRCRGRGLEHAVTGRAAPAVALDGVSYSYPDGYAALHSIDLTVAPGERVAILGPNGAGKTTLVLTLNGIRMAQAGTVTIGGLAVSKP